MAEAEQGRIFPLASAAMPAKFGSLKAVTGGASAQGASPGLGDPDWGGGLRQKKVTSGSATRWSPMVEFGRWRTGAGHRGSRYRRLDRGMAEEGWHY
jgi:hypothetical protein